jgi:hypothetical protein
MNMLLALALCMALASTASAKYVEYTFCNASKYWCSGESCFSVSIPEGSCQPAGQGRSQILSCVPNAALCLEADYWNATSCTGFPTGRNDLVCGECYPQKDGTFKRVDCAYINDTVPFVNVTRCTDSRCAPSTCSWNATETLVYNTCLPREHDGQQEGMLTLRGFKPCSLLAIGQFKSADCTSTPSIVIVPARSCLDGVTVSCHEGTASGPQPRV